MKIFEFQTVGRTAQAIFRYSLGLSIKTAIYHYFLTFYRTNI